MKLVTFSVATDLGRFERVGATMDAEGQRIVDLQSAFLDLLEARGEESNPAGLAALRLPTNMIGLLDGGAASLEAAAMALGHAIERGGEATASNGARLVFDAGEVRLLSPIPRPRSLRCFSIYAEHMTRADPPFERNDAWYRYPIYYKGNANAILGPGDPIPFPHYTKRLDLEIELGIVIGRKARNLTVEEAGEVIAGYTVCIDASCRDGYEREPFGPTKRKDFATVLGPCMVTADEIDHSDLAARIVVDGETWFEGNTGRERFFTPEQIVAFASDSETLMPGDVLASGTIGFGCSMDLHRWVKVGQTVRHEIAGIGALEHQIVAGEQVVNHVGGMDSALRKG